MSEWADRLTEMVTTDLKGWPARDWFMEPAERLALFCMLDHLRPEVAIEIGTQRGGSLQALVRFCKTVYAIDVDPACKTLGTLGGTATVIYKTGPSAEMLPRVLVELKAKAADLGFILIDGDHSADGVRRDIENAIAWVPRRSTYIVLHDAMNPSVRAGIRAADWGRSPHVHQVEVDFVPGILVEDNATWGGFALAVMRAMPRAGTLTVSARYQGMYDRLVR